MAWIRGPLPQLPALLDHLDEQRGLVKIVPPLIEADRERRWDEIGRRPGDPNLEMIEIYESEAGSEERWGHADFGRTVRSAAIMTSWEAFHDYLIRELAGAAFRYDLKNYPVLDRLVQDEESRWSRRFDDVVRRYQDFLGVRLPKLEGWDKVTHCQELRNALTHNFGLYTTRYVAHARSVRPDPEDLMHSWAFADQDLVDYEFIPLSTQFVLEVLDELGAYAIQVDEVVVASFG